jgi:hypothetical protein
MKRLIAIVIAVIAVLAMTVPAMAVTTQVNIGGTGGGNPPFVLCKFETPDEPNPIPTDDGTVDIYPEAPVPPFDTVGTDGWKQINYYLVVDDPDNDIYITGVDIIVKYPDGSEKYNLHVTRCYPNWIISGGPGPETYPTTPVTPANVPAQSVRELKYDAGTQTWDKVDANADGDTADACDLAIPEFLTAYGSRVTYGPNALVGGSFTRDQVVAALEERDPDNTGKAIMLELVSYIWCHQQPVTYTVDAVALANEQSEVLTNTFNFVPQASLYLDFTDINWGNLSSPAIVLKEGDRVLGTALLPTIWNNGNFAGMVSVAGTKMLWDTNGNGVIDTEELGNAGILGKYIDCFDVHMDQIVDGATIQQGMAIFNSASGPVLITETDGTPVLLPPCTPTQIDFSIIAPSGLMNGKYFGTITITIDNYEDDSE